MYGSPQLTVDKKFQGSINKVQTFEAPIDPTDPKLAVDYFAKRAGEINRYLVSRIWYFDDPYVLTSEQWDLFIRNLKSLLDSATLRGVIHIQIPPGPQQTLAEASVKMLRERIENRIKDAEYNRDLVASEERTQSLTKQIQAAQQQQSSAWFWWMSGAILIGGGVLYYRKRQRSRNA